MPFLFFPIYLWSFLCDVTISALDLNSSQKTGLYFEAIFSTLYQGSSSNSAPLLLPGTIHALWLLPGNHEAESGIWKFLLISSCVICKISALPSSTPNSPDAICADSFGVFAPRLTDLPRSSTSICSSFIPGALGWQHLPLPPHPPSSRLSLRGLGVNLNSRWTLHLRLVWHHVPPQIQKMDFPCCSPGFISRNIRFPFKVVFFSLSPSYQEIVLLWPELTEVQRTLKRWQRQGKVADQNLWRQRWRFWMCSFVCVCGESELQQTLQQHRMDAW